MERKQLDVFQTNLCHALHAHAIVYFVISAQSMILVIYEYHLMQNVEKCSVKTCNRIGSYKDCFITSLYNDYRSILLLNSERLPTGFECHVVRDET